MVRSSPLRRTLSLAASLPAQRWAALAEAAAWIAWTRALLTLRPWREVSARFEREPLRPGPPDWTRANLTLWAVHAVARRVLPEKPCLTQALAARTLLRRLGVDTQLRLGAARDGERGFRAHAWLEHDGDVVMGRMHAGHYVPFVPAHPSPRAAS